MRLQENEKGEATGGTNPRTQPMETTTTTTTQRRPRRERRQPRVRQTTTKTTNNLQTKRRKHDENNENDNEATPNGLGRGKSSGPTSGASSTTSRRTNGRRNEHDKAERGSGSPYQRTTSRSDRPPLSGHGGGTRTSGTRDRFRIRSGRRWTRRGRPNGNRQSRKERTTGRPIGKSATSTTSYNNSSRSEKAANDDAEGHLRRKRQFDRRWQRPTTRDDGPGYASSCGTNANAFAEKSQRNILHTFCGTSRQEDGGKRT